MSINGFDVGVDTSAVVEVEPSKVQLSDVASVVHVAEEDVHILGCAKSWNKGKVWRTSVICLSIFLTNYLSSKTAHCKYLPISDRGPEHIR